MYPDLTYLVTNYPTTKPPNAPKNVTLNIKDPLTKTINTTLPPFTESPPTKNKLKPKSRKTDPFPPLSPSMKISYLINLESMYTKLEPKKEVTPSKSLDGESKPVPLIG